MSQRFWLVYPGGGSPKAKFFFWRHKNSLTLQHRRPFGLKSLRLLLNRRFLNSKTGIQDIPTMCPPPTSPQPGWDFGQIGCGRAREGASGPGTMRNTCAGWPAVDSPSLLQLPLQSTLCQSQNPSLAGVMLEGAHGWDTRILPVSHIF